MVKKIHNFKTTTNLRNQHVFQDSLNNLFDVAHRNAKSLKLKKTACFYKHNEKTQHRNCKCSDYSIWSSFVIVV